MRRSTILVLGAAALVLAACEIRTDYAMVVDEDTSATLAFEISYDEEAAELFGPAESFLEEEVEGDAASDIEGVTLVSAEADSSDPENQRVTATFEARDAEALDRLLADLFPNSSFTNEGGSTWVLSLRPDADVAEEFGDEFALEELGLDFLSGEVRIDHAGSQVSMTGGTAEGGNLVVWNPYGADSLEVVMDLSGATPPDPEPGDQGEGSAEEPAEEPAEESVEEPADEPAEEPTEAPADEPGTEDAEIAATVAEDDGGGGFLPLLLAAVVLAVLLAALLLFLVLRGRGRSDGASGQPAAVGATPGGYQPPPGGAGPGGYQPPPGGAGPSQQPTQPWQQTPPGQPPAPPPSASPPPPPPPQGR